MLWSGSSHTLRVRSEFGLEQQQQQRELEQQRKLKQQQRAQLEQQPRPEGLRRELLRLDRGAASARRWERVLQNREREWRAVEQRQARWTSGGRRSGATNRLRRYDGMMAMTVGERSWWCSYTKTARRAGGGV